MLPKALLTHNSSLFTPHILALPPSCCLDFVDVYLLPSLGPMSPLPVVPGGDKISQLQELVQKGERRGVFSDSMPPEIRRSVSLAD